MAVPGFGKAAGYPVPFPGILFPPRELLAPGLGNGLIGRLLQRKGSGTFPLHLGPDDRQLADWLSADLLYRGCFH